MKIGIRSQVSSARATFLLGKDSMSTCVGELDDILSRIEGDVEANLRHHNNTLGQYPSKMATKAKLDFDGAVAAVAKARERTDCYNDNGGADVTRTELMIITVADALCLTIIASESLHQWRKFLFFRHKDMD